jgi:hypothetical protein
MTPIEASITAGLYQLNPKERKAFFSRIIPSSIGEVRQARLSIQAPGTNPVIVSAPKTGYTITIAIQVSNTENRDIKAFAENTFPNLLIFLVRFDQGFTVHLKMPPPMQVLESPTATGLQVGNVQFKNNGEELTPR